MRKYIYLLALVGMFNTGCHDLLDIKPTNKIPAEDLFKDPNGANAFLAGIYNDLPIEDYMYMPGTNDNGSAGFNNPNGNIGNFWLANACDEAIQSQWGETGPGYILRGDYFNKGYATLRNVNFLKNLIPTLEIEESEKDILKGEAAFMTAYIYFYLAQKFGGVPIIKSLQEYDPNSPESLVVPRSTEFDTWDYIMQQCDEAYANLPEERNDRRATKYVAMALKSRAALVAASVAKFGELAPINGEAVDLGLAGMKKEDANYFYDKCIDACEKIIESNQYYLYKANPNDRIEAEKNYRDIFTKPNEIDGEAIFIKGILKEGLGSSLNVFNEPFQTKGQGRISPALELVDAYETYEDVEGKRSDGRIRTKENEDFSTSGFNTEDNYYEVNKDEPYQLFDGTAFNDEKRCKDARLWASIILPGTVWKNTKIIIQGGLIETNGNEIYRVETTSKGKDGKDYHSLGGPNASVSGFYSDGQHSMSGFLMKKMMSEECEAQYNKTTTDYIVFRYAEILLNYAEAVYESNNDEKKGLAEKYLNDIRKRAAHTNNIPLTRENIRLERQVELAFENLRVWDLKRWRLLHTIYKNYSHQILVPYLDLRKDNPVMIYVRKTSYGASLNGPGNYSIDEYYEDVPRNSINNMIQNP